MKEIYLVGDLNLEVKDKKINASVDYNDPVCLTRAGIKFWGERANFYKLGINIDSLMYKREYPNEVDKNK